MRLIVVESPTKASTIKQFLGEDYEVRSSYGHIRDLPKGKLGIDLENNFEPTYVIPTKARKAVTSLKNATKKAEEVILATDEDREGEAIAWHLSETLGLKDAERIVFHEITEQAIQEALKNPRSIDLNRVNAQQARRILDRLVGYKLSPFLWKKVARGLSAGRVQSVAVRLVSDREEEIKKFKPKEYWSISAFFEKDKKTFEAALAKKAGEAIDKFAVGNKKEADAILKVLKGAEYIIEKIEQKETKRHPLPPFTTSTLQQTASSRLGFSAKRTMQLAQLLYEQGFITYHRTDSLNLSTLAQNAAKSFIETAFGKDYWPGFSRQFKTKAKGAQEAHEAIRPTFAERTPEQTKLSGHIAKLYDLIWRRFLASQMSPAVFDATTVDIAAKEYTFRATGQMLKFDGFLKVYPLKFEETDLPQLKEQEVLSLQDLVSSQHFTEPPPRYTEATLVKALEEFGIGRPSTYAPILSTIQERGYVAKDERKRLMPTELGTAVNNILVQHFPTIVDIGFTADMEEELDEIAEGKQKWTPMLKEFYDPFSKTLEKKYEEVKKEDLLSQDTGKTCPECGAPLVMRLGRFGKFYACSRFPECRHTEPLEERKPQSIGMVCPKCQQGDVVAKRTRRGKIFYGCNRYPECDFASWQKPEKDSAS